MADLDEDPVLFAMVGLAIAGFEIPNNGDVLQAGNDFKLVYAVDRGIELGIQFIVENGRYDVEARLLSADEGAVRTAALLLARATGDIRCTVDPEDGALCLTRSMDRTAESAPDDLALMAAELAAAAVELAQAKADDAPAEHRHDAATENSLIIRG